MAQLNALLQRAGLPSLNAGNLAYLLCTAKTLKIVGLELLQEGLWATEVLALTVATVTAMP